LNEVGHNGLVGLALINLVLQLRDHWAGAWTIDVITADQKLVAATDAYEPLAQFPDALTVSRERKRSRRDEEDKNEPSVKPAFQKF
jgi:hypothetical protein